MYCIECMNVRNWCWEFQKKKKKHKKTTTTKHTNPQLCKHRQKALLKPTESNRNWSSHNEINSQQFEEQKQTNKQKKLL